MQYKTIYNLVLDILPFLLILGFLLTYVSNIIFKIKFRVVCFSVLVSLHLGAHPQWYQQETEL